MLPHDDIRSVIQAQRESIERSRWQFNNDVRSHPRRQFSNQTDVLLEKQPVSLKPNEKFWNEVESVGKDHSNFTTKSTLPFREKSPFVAETARKQKPIVNREEEIRRFAEKCSNAGNFFDYFGRGRLRPSEMVRVGEFSPQNPHLQTTGRSLLGLGEYEERRRLLLQRKREEYHQEMAQVAQAQKIANQNVSPSKTQKITRDCYTQTDLTLLSPEQSLPVEVQSNGSIPTKPNALFDVQTGTQLLPEVPGIKILSPRSQSPSSPERRRIDLTIPDSYSQIVDMSEDRFRKLCLKEDLQKQIEEKRRLEAERQEREAREEEALARRVAEQQARLQAEFEEEERLRRQKEREKQFQTEEFLRRTEQLLLESEQLKIEQRRKRVEALNALAEQQTSPPILLSNQKVLSEQQLEESAPVPQEQLGEQTKESKKGAPPSKAGSKGERQGRNAHLVPPVPAAPISILKSTSPPPRSPREGVPVRADIELEPPSPRALIKVLEGPTYRGRQPRNQVPLEDSLPIPLMRQTRTPSPCNRTKPTQRFPPVLSTRSNPNSAVAVPSEAMLRLEDKWKVPAVQKNVMTKRKVGQWGDGSEGHTVLTQLGSFRRQLQEEHMRMEKKIRDCEREAKLEDRIRDSERPNVS